MTDDELIRRFVTRREEHAFRELYARHTPAVYGFVLRLTGGREQDAADVMQDAWLRAATRIHQFRGESAFRTWFTGIALNCYRELVRTRVRVPEIAGAVSEPSVQARDGAVDVEQVLHSMAPPYREVLVLHDVEGYTHEEIAGALGIEVGTSKSRLSRARHLFRAMWSALPAPTGAEA